VFKKYSQDFDLDHVGFVDLGRTHITELAICEDGVFLLTQVFSIIQ